jgi:hypothetical protein
MYIATRMIRSAAFTEVRTVLSVKKIGKSGGEAGGGGGKKSVAHTTETAVTITTTRMMSQGLIV